MRPAIRDDVCREHAALCEAERAPAHFVFDLPDPRLRITIPDVPAIVAIADRIYGLAENGRVVRLRPETAWLVERAVRSYAARPTREQLMALFCVRSNCDRAACMHCMGKANAVLRLYEGPQRDGW